MMNGNPEKNAMNRGDTSLINVERRTPCTFFWLPPLRRREVKGDKHHQERERGGDREGR